MRAQPLAETLREMPEKEWQSQVVQLAKTLGWTHYHTYRSRKSPSGFPDLVLVRDRVIFAELKRENKRLTQVQAEWMDALLAAGAEFYVWRPGDLEDVGRILQNRKLAEDVEDS